MSDIFLEVLNTSIAAGWVVLAVLLARLLLRKAPRSLVCGLWSLVGGRLLIGRSLEAPFSLIPSAEVIPPESLYDRSPTIDSGVPIIDRVVNPVYTGSFQTDGMSSVNPLQVWMAIWANLWLLGMIIMLLWALFSWLRIRRQVRESVPETKDVFLCDRISSPFIFGVICPKIYLPSDLDDAAKSHVLAHERAHLARRDHWWKPLGFLLLTVNWFNPMMWVAYILLCRDIEMACDERVVSTLVLEEKKAYSSALLQCSLPRRAIAACPLAFGEVGVKTRIKSVLHYKKPAFWVILVTLVLIAVLAAVLLTTPESESAEIRYNSVLYIQEGEPVTQIPDKQQATDSLRSVLHDSTKHPEENGQAVRLGWEYAGQPFVIVGNVLYLEQPGGGEWLPFLLRTPQEFIFDSLQQKLDYLVSVKTERVQEWETLPDSKGDALLQALDSLRTTTFEPIAESQIPKRILEVCFMRDSLTSAFNLYLSADEVWTLSFYDAELGSNLWRFRNAALTQWAQPYLSRASYYDSILSGEYNTVVYQTYENRGLSLTIGLPDGWRSEQTSKNSFDGIAFRFWPEDAEGFLHLQYEPEASWTLDGDRTCVDSTFPTGISAKRFERRDGTWDHMIFNTTYGSLLVTRQLTSTWTEEQLQMAESILATVTAFAQGQNTMQQPDPLGITLRADNVSCFGLRLFLTQKAPTDLWKKIVTKTQYTLEKWENEGWVNVVPEDAIWSNIQYETPINGTTAENIDFTSITGTLPEGRYRIGKTFLGYPNVSNSSLPSIEQTCYAEFTVNPLGITLSVENVTPNGLTLFCTQDGTPFSNITTGAPWSLEQKTEEGWVSVMPEETVWTAIAYGVNQGQTTRWNINWHLIRGELPPGTYRIGKHFSATPAQPPWFYDPQDAVEQTCYAEFIIE